MFLPKQPHGPINIHHDPKVHDTRVHDTRRIHDCLQLQGQGKKLVHIFKSDQGHVWANTKIQDCTGFPSTTPVIVWIPPNKKHPRNMDKLDLPHEFYPGC